MSEQAIHVGVLISALALAGWVFAAQPHSPATATRSAAQLSTEPLSPLAVVPPGSAFVLDADVARLEQAPLGPFLAERLFHLVPSDLSALCGFDPLTRLTRLALAVPGAGEATEAQADDFGIVATGRFSAAEISHCASAAITHRGGHAVSSRLGSFETVRDLKGSGGEVAAKDGLLVVSGGSYFRQLLDSAEGNAPERDPADSRAARHSALRRKLGSGDIVATWLLSPGWFARISGDNDARLSPLSALQALGARVIVGGDVRVSVLLVCADPDGAKRIADLITDMRTSLGSLALPPTLSELPRRIELRSSGSELFLALTLERDELGSVLGALLGP
ncbi:MAG TPA: hypothetical protein VGL19_12895 [Polyangiaceae bacterium]